MKIFIFALLFQLNTFASERFNISLSTFAQSQRISRGAVIWPRSSMMLGPSFSFYQRLILRGPNINYSQFSKQDDYIASLGVSLFDDNRPLIRLEQYEKTFRNKRKTSLNANLNLGFKFIKIGNKKRGVFGIRFYKELIQYYGQFLDLYLKVPLLPFTSIQTTFQLNDKESAKYYYGDNAKGGLGNIVYQLNFVWPFLPWKGVIINTLQFHNLQSKTNHNADYIRGDDKNWVYRLMISWQVY